MEKNLKRMTRYLLGAGALGFAMLASATVPVVDWASLANEGTEIGHLVDQVNLLKEQLATATGELHSMTGGNALGEWKNDLADLSYREWSPSDWRSALSSLSSENLGKFNQLMAEYENTHPALTPENIKAYGQGASESMSSMFHEQVSQSQASQAIASGAYAEVNDDFKTLSELGRQIGNKEADPDLKHAVDLNSRVQLEVGNLAVQQLRMLALLNEQLAQNQATYLEQEQDAAAYLARDVSSGS